MQSVAKKATDYPKMMSVPQVAEYMNTSRGTIYKLIRKGVITTVPGLKRNMRINRDVLANLGREA